MSHGEGQKVVYGDDSRVSLVFPVVFYAAWLAVLVWFAFSGVARAILWAVVGCGAIAYIVVAPPYRISFDGTQIEKTEGRRTRTIDVDGVTELEVSRGLYTYDLFIRDERTCISISLDEDTEELRRAIGEALRGRLLLVTADGRARHALFPD